MIDQSRKPNTPNNASHLVFIDLLRGCACLAVLIYHFFYYWAGNRVNGGWIVHSMMQLASLGYLGVSLFLVISGFCLFYPIVRKHEKPFEAPFALKEYGKRRLYRILPPYYYALLLFVFLNYLMGNPLISSGNVLAHVFMIHNLLPSHVLTINGAFWSLALEFQLYILFPLFLLFGRFYGMRGILLLSAIGSLVWQAALYFLLPPNTPVGILMVTWYSVVSRCFEFTLGMAAAYIVVRSPLKWQRYAFLALMVLTPIAVCFTANYGNFYPLIQQLWGIIFASLLVVCAGASRVKESGLGKLLIWFGGISYSVYLLHQPFLIYVAGFASKTNGVGSVTKFLLGVGFFVGLCLVSYLFHLIFERPFMHHLSRANQRR